MSYLNLDEELDIYKEDKVDKKLNWPNIYQNIGWHHPA